MNLIQQPTPVPVEAGPALALVALYAVLAVLVIVALIAIAAAWGRKPAEPTSTATSPVDSRRKAARR